MGGVCSKDDTAISAPAAIQKNVRALKLPPSAAVSKRSNAVSLSILLTRILHSTFFPQASQDALDSTSGKPFEAVYKMGDKVRALVSFIEFGPSRGGRVWFDQVVSATLSYFLIQSSVHLIDSWEKEPSRW